MENHVASALRHEMKNEETPEACGPCPIPSGKCKRRQSKEKGSIMRADNSTMAIPSGQRRQSYTYGPGAELPY